MSEQTQTTDIGKELIGSFKLTTTRGGKRPVINLYSVDTRLSYPVLQLFDISMIQDIGIDPLTLVDGEPYHVRFWAYYKVSEKKKSTGTPYKDVQMLEPAGPKLAVAGVPDDLKALLRGLQVDIQSTHRKLDQITQALGIEQKPGPAAPPVSQEAEDEPDLEAVFQDLEESECRQNFWQLVGPAKDRGDLTPQQINDFASIGNWKAALIAATTALSS